MGEVVNLPKRRKALLCSKKDLRTAANRLRFGRPFDEWQLTEAIKSKYECNLDGSYIESGDES